MNGTFAKVANSCGRLLLGVVLLGASLAKARDIEGTERSLVQTGVRSELVPFASRLVPATEFALGIGLFWPQVRSAAAKLTVGLLLSFTTYIWRNIALGKTSHCACFGQHFESVSGWTAILRNLLLISVTIPIGWPSLPHQLRSLRGKLSYRETVAVVASLAVPTVLAVEGWRRVGAGRDLRRESGPAIGAEVPDSVVEDSSGASSRLSRFLHSSSGQDHLLFFAGLGCGPCQETLAHLDTLRTDGEVPDSIQNLRILVLDQVDNTGSLDDSIPVGLQQKVLFDASKNGNNGGLAARLGIFHVPTAVAFDPQSWRITDSATGQEEVMRLINRDHEIVRSGH